MTGIAEAGTSDGDNGTDDVYDPRCYVYYKAPVEQ